jgi:hypothetical protein
MSKSSTNNCDMPDSRVVVLMRIGFVLVGKWEMKNDEPRIIYVKNPEEEAISKSSPALYAFVVNGLLKYIGKTTQILHKRLYGYAKPGKSQATNLKCQEGIVKALKDGDSVDVYGFAPDVPLCYDQFQINLPAGLEDAIIKIMKPTWNGKQAATGIIESESAVNERQAIGESGEPENLTSQNVKTVASFRIKLGETYYNTGLINPGVDADKYIGAHGEPMCIHLGAWSENPVWSQIDRGANRNGSARIQSRTAVAEWFRENFKLRDAVKVNIIDRNDIVLMKSQERSTNK